jgi:hypothetical protein
VPGLSGWIKDVLREVGGQGSLYLLRGGNVALRIPSVLNAGLSAISEACDACLDA